MSLGGGGDFEKGKKDPNEPKVIFLLIKTYFSEYLRPERSPAARCCACSTFDEFGGPFKKGKRDPRGITLLVIDLET